MLLPHRNKLFSRTYSPVIGEAVLDTLRRVGQDSNLEILLDAGDSNAYPGTGQTWTDLSGNGNNFNLGATSGAEASDPTFVGVAGGKSADDYFQFDGGDYFTKASANTTFINSWHKNNAIFSLYAWVWGIAGSLNNNILGTSGNSSSNRGIYFRGSGNEGVVRFVCQNGSGADDQTVNSEEGTFRLGAWNFVALMVDEGASITSLMVNDYFGNNSSGYTAPSASDASFALQLGARGNGAVPYGNGGRIQQFGAWSRYITRFEMIAIRDATAGRFPSGQRGYPY